MKMTSFLWDASAVATGLEEIAQSRNLLLGHLKYLLDSFHGVERTIEYYDLVCGDWLNHFAENIYSSWREVLSGTDPVKTSLLPVVKSPMHAHTLSTDIAWHRHLHWAVSQRLQAKSSVDWSVAAESVHIESGSHLGTKRKLLRSISTTKPKVLLTQPNFKCSRQEWLVALWHWRSWIALDGMQYPISVTSNVDWLWRKKHSTKSSLPPRDFAELVMSLMPLYFPVALLEGFEEYRASVLALSLPRPQVVFSTTSLYGDLTFKIQLSEWRQDGTKLLYHQHGGGYGLDSQFTMEDYEINVSDQFYSWGWTREDSTVKPLSPALPTTKLKQRTNNILLNCVDLPRVPYRIVLMPMPGTIETIHRNTCDFLRVLPHRQNLMIRPFPVDYGWGAVESMRVLAPEARFDSRSSIFALFAEAGLVVHNYLGTSWLETLGLNIPTICFFDPAVYVYRAEAQPALSAMQKVGILHHSGKDAARFVASLGKDIEGWWHKSEVQDARRNFVERYANFSPDWKKQWEREFEAVLDGTR